MCIRDRLREVVGDRAKVVTAKGSNLIGDADYEKRATMFGRELHRDNRTDRELLDEALKVAAGADVIVAALGESSEMSGESLSLIHIYSSRPVVYLGYESHRRVRPYSCRRSQCRRYLVDIQPDGGRQP